MIVVDPEFRALIPPLRPEEREQLEANLIKEGCRDALVVWRQNGKAVLLDGHNRFDICTARGIEFKTEAVELPDREAAADWIDANQLGRRNLAPEQSSMLRGRRYNRAKNKRDDNLKQNAPKGQNVPSVNTAKKIAEQHGVDERTVKRDGQFADAVEKVKQVDPEIEKKVVSGKAPPKGRIVEAAKQLEKAEREAKEVAAAPLLPSRKDREAAEILEKAAGKAAAILNGSATIAQVKREVARQEKREQLEAKAEAAKSVEPEAAPAWQIVEGDCLEILPTVAAGSVRLIFADPPYNIGIRYGDHHDDNMESEDFMKWCEDWMRACVERLTPDGSMWVLINDEWADVFGCLLRDVGLHRRSWIKWYESFGVNTSSNFNRCSRHLFYMVKSRDRFVFNDEAVSRPSDRQMKYGDKRADPGGKLWDNVWGINPPIPRLVENAKERLPDFPTQLPLALLRPIIACASEPGDLILDPFNGSGSTGEAALRLGRRYTGIEQSAEFARLARLRLMATRGGFPDEA